MLTQDAPEVATAIRVIERALADEPVPTPVRISALRVLERTGNLHRAPRMYRGAWLFWEDELAA
uniref:Uncharacterized protein n=1 Tax=Streptomyces sp. NBC_00049 TaxID=2903617 RepID=A0AAU2JIY0_9ACTN